MAMKILQWESRRKSFISAMVHEIALIKTPWNMKKFCCYVFMLYGGKQGITWNKAIPFRQ